VLEFMEGVLPRLGSDIGDELLADAFALDAARIREENCFTDLAAQLLEELARPVPSEIDWINARFQLVPHAQLLQTRWPLTTWLAGESPVPEEDPEYFVLTRRGGKVVSHKISVVESLLLEFMRAPATVEELGDRLILHLEGESLTRTEIITNVAGKVRLMTQTGIVLSVREAV
jgi:hypothetical protein